MLISKRQPLVTWLTYYASYFPFVLPMQDVLSPIWCSGNLVLLTAYGGSLTLWLSLEFGKVKIEKSH